MLVKHDFAYGAIAAQIKLYVRSHIGAYQRPHLAESSLAPTLSPARPSMTRTTASSTPD